MRLSFPLERRNWGTERLNYLVQGHSAIKWQSEDSNPDDLTSVIQHFSFEEGIVYQDDNKKASVQDLNKNTEIKVEERNGEGQVENMVDEDDSTEEKFVIEQIQIINKDSLSLVCPKWLYKTGAKIRD